MAALPRPALRRSNATDFEETVTFDGWIIHDTPPESSEGSEEVPGPAPRNRSRSRGRDATRVVAEQARDQARRACTWNSIDRAEIEAPRTV